MADHDDLPPENAPISERPLPLSGEPRRRRRRDEDDDRPAPSSGSSAGIIIAVILVVGFGLVILVLIGLLVPAVAKVRESAASVRTNSHLKQCALAVHTYHDKFRRFPNAFGPLPAGAEPFGAEARDVSMWVQLLPYLEAVDAYRAGNTNALIVPYSSPSAPNPAAPGTIAFAGNLRIFGNVTLANADSLKDPMPVQGGEAVCGPGFAGILDGLTNTIMLTTKYDDCGGVKTYYAADIMGNINGAPAPTPGLGGFTGAGSPSTPPVRRNPPDTTIFQLAPSPNECVAKAGLFGQAFGSGGISVALADGAVRNIHPGMNPMTFRCALCPSDGAPLAADWSDDN